MQEQVRDRPSVTLGEVVDMLDLRVGDADIAKLVTAEKERVARRVIASIRDKNTVRTHLAMSDPAHTFVNVDRCVTYEKLALVEKQLKAKRNGINHSLGKDPTKVDRSGAYAARWVAVNIVAAGLAKRCEVQIAYAIGEPKPVSATVDTFGTGTVPDDGLSIAVYDAFDLSVSGIIRCLGLRAPIYAPLAAYGHFGRQKLNLPWEQTDKRTALLKSVAALGYQV